MPPMSIKRWNMQHLKMDLNKRLRLRNEIKILGSLLVCFAVEPSCATLATKTEKPNITICISDPANTSFQCSDNGTDKYTLPYSKSENYIGLPIDDWEEVMLYLEEQENECRENFSIW